MCIYALVCAFVCLDVSICLSVSRDIKVYVFVLPDVATCVSQVPRWGGALSFSKADVYLRPQHLSATLFTYDGLDNILDTDFTELSGCPVRDGEHEFAILWLREGLIQRGDVAEWWQLP